MVRIGRSTTLDAALAFRQAKGVLVIEDLRFSLGGRPLFDQASVRIPLRAKVGVVGRNGAGKSTLFRLLKGELQPEAGRIVVPKGLRIGSVAQEPPAGTLSVMEAVLAADDELTALRVEAETAQDPAAIGVIQARLTDIGAWSAEARAAQILRGLGFTQADFAKPCAALSGGWQMRVALAAVLFAGPDLLLLDEPTNHLDLESALWLEDYLARYPHTVLVISHDRGFLNRAVNAILSLEGGKLRLWPGGFEAFLSARAAERAQLAKASREEAKRRTEIEAFVARFRAKASKARQAQARLKLLQKMQAHAPAALPEDLARVAFSFPEPRPLPGPLVSLAGVAVGYGDKPILKNLSLRIDPDDRIALLGRNGQGKSTLARLLAGVLEPMRGQITRAPKLGIGYFAQNQLESLDQGATALMHLVRLRPDESQTSLRARLARFGLGAEVAEMPIAALSGGQKARLALCLATFHAPQLLVLDEPTNHLDLESREALVAALNAWSGAAVIVSHDFDLLARLADRLWLIEGGTVRPWEEDLEAYRAHVLGQAANDEATPQSPKTQTPERRAGAKTGLHGTHEEERERQRALRALAAKVQAAEARLEKLAVLRRKLEEKLADPALYAALGGAPPPEWTEKHKALLDALDHAEAEWLEAVEALEKARSGKADV